MNRIAESWKGARWAAGAVLALAAAAAAGPAAGVAGLGAGRADEVSRLEERLGPWLEARAGSKAAGLAKAGLAVSAPSQGDLFQLANDWDAVSPKLRALYEKTAGIPTNFPVYVTPSGLLEVYYTLSGVDAVDPADTYGFSATNWRTRVAGANGVPDYVDEVAWALDSAWVMEVTRFQFPKPYPYQSVYHRSTRYKVVVKSLEEGLYGMTYFVARVQGTSFGYSSYIELRNNWTGWDKGGENNYELYPERAAHITCAHEFFHAVQFAMLRNVRDYRLRDDYPLAWIEATAVAMEEAAFDHVNDYTQYSYGLFGLRHFPVLREDIPEGYEYGSSIFAVYTWQFWPRAGGIDFIRNIFVNNTANLTPFYENLESTSLSMGFRWRDLLADFFAGCYFVGTRFDGRFSVKDAPQFAEWTYRSLNDTIPAYAMLAYDTIRPYGMSMFSFLRDASMQGGRMTMTFTGTFPTLVAQDQTWGLRLVLMKGGKVTPDSLVPVSVSAAGKATAVVENWTDYDEAVLVFSNSHSSERGRGEVLFDAPPGTPVTRSPAETIRTALGPTDFRLFRLDGREVSELTGLQGVVGQRLVGAVLAGRGSGAFPASMAGLATGTYLLRVQGHARVPFDTRGGPLIVTLY